MRLNAANTAILKRLLVGRDSRPLRSILAKIEPAEIASLLPNLTIAETQIICESLLAIGQAHKTLFSLPDQHLKEIVERLPDKDHAALLSGATDADAARIIGVMEQEKWDYYLGLIVDARRSKVERFLNYPEDSAGRLMQTKVFTLGSNLTATQAIEEIRRRSQEESIYYIYCVDAAGNLEGICSLRQIVTSHPSTTLSTIQKRELLTVGPIEPAKKAADMVAKYNLIAIPVVDDQKKLIGILTVDDIVDLLQEQATAEVYASAGLQEDDRIYTAPIESMKKRMPWMLVNLALAAVASTVVSIFEDTMSVLIILASLKNIVAGVAGNTAIQSLTVVMRGIAVGDFQFTSVRRVLLKELLVGILIGSVTGLSAGLLTYVWKGDVMVSVVMCVSMVINSIVASSFGSAIPLALHKFKLDPATGSGPIVTMISDIFSFFSFLGIASLGLNMIQS